MKVFGEIYFKGILLVALSMMLLACGGETQNNEQSADTVKSDTSAAAESAAQMAPDSKLNINTASEEAFLKLPGVGDNMVHEFEEYRPYASIRQFRQEIGKYVDEETVARYENYIYVPININESDAATLQQIPGLEAGEAQKLMDSRPFENKQEFIEALGQYVSEGDIEVAKRYLNSN